MPPKTAAALSASMRKMLARLASLLAASALPDVARSSTRREPWNTPASAMTRASRIGIVPASERGVALLDHTAAEADVAVVEHDRLARRDGALRLVEDDLADVAGDTHRARLIGLPVARLRRAAERPGRRRAVDPGRRVCDEPRR